MTQHSQNGEGMEAIDRLLRFAQSPEATIGEHDDILTVVALARQSLAREPATADVETDNRGEAMICTGCGTSRTVAAIKSRSATAFTCCPERKMIPARSMWDAWCARQDTAPRQSTVAFVQEWLINSDHAPTKWDRDFAAAIDARVVAASAVDLATRFCAAPLPDDVCADQCATVQGSGRTGPNLLTVDQAARMFDAALSRAAPSSGHAIAEGERVEKAARYVLDNSRRGNASLNSDQYDADTQKLMTAYRDIIGKALASGFLSAAPSAPATQAGEEA